MALEQCFCWVCSANNTHPLKVRLLFRKQTSAKTALWHRFVLDYPTNVDFLGPQPAFGLGPGGKGTGGSVIPATSAALKTVDRVRNVFPETWLWSNASVGFVVQIILIRLKSDFFFESKLC